MDFSNDELKRIISGKPVGNIYPYNTGDTNEIEKYLRDLYYKLNRSGLIKCHGEFAHYGSGYASYIDLFCLKRNEINPPENALGKLGIVVYISRLAPVAVFGYDDRTETGFCFLDPLHSDFGKLPDGDWDNEFLEIKSKIEAAGIHFLEKEYVEQPLAFTADIPTILTIPDMGDVYRNFDAFFYWED